ncbi:MAG TPA: hypothetical protein VFX49_04150 [Chloroflexota bacterium]|nr:hypothetical protein [Chloroflexota bacterium]
MRYRKAADPVGNGDLYVYLPDALEASLSAAAEGAPAAREVLAADAPPAEADVRTLERQLRAQWVGRARRALGWALWWVLVGPALTLAWANLAAPISRLFFWLPPLRAALATLGETSGGPLLALAVTLAPWAWAWSRAAGDFARARHDRRLARAAASRRVREAPLRREADADLAAFAREGDALRARLREGAASIGERGADGAGEAADAARQLSVLAARHGLDDVAALYHALYTRFGASERRLSRAERGGAGVLAERRAGGEARRVQREVRSLLARFRPGYRPPASPLAPALGALAGIVVLVGTFVVTGFYVVGSDEALFLDSAGSRLARAAGMFGLPAGDRSPAVVRGPAMGWDAPFPLTGRRRLSLATQPIVISARFRGTAAGAVDLIQVQLGYQVAYVERWAALDADGAGAQRLTLGLSSQLEEYIQGRRQEAAQMVVAQTPQLGNDRQQVMARADALVEQNLDALVRVFIGSVAPDVAEEAGVQIGTDFQARIRRGVSMEEANALLGE